MRVRKDKKRGQELVEFAIALPLLLLIMFGVLDLGRLFHATIVIANASREGARYASSFGFTKNTSGGIDLSVASIAARAEQEAQNSGITLSSVTVNCPSCDNGKPVTVTVTSNFLFLFNTFLGNGLTLSHATEMMIPW